MPPLRFACCSIPGERRCRKRMRSAHCSRVPWPTRSVSRSSLPRPSCCRRRCTLTACRRSSTKAFCSSAASFLEGPTSAAPWSCRLSGSPWVAKVAKAAAGRAAEFACTQAQQTYGAIGFTWEHGFHRYLRRAYVLDWLLGDWRALEFEIGDALRMTGEVPRIGVLGG